ncbi:TD and POZ domain-containing protein 1-like [Daphnia pulex]|uniref:TD and POZ domain-containing protein 1-like n=1 Tax=Daphnia pulex TaxID=6669 RepID=UPI001EDDA8C6|nr:TD and POZ domain-containing protein 1-like [Daphnia pulex]
MASMQKIREGIFKISWKSPQQSYNNKHVEENWPEIAESLTLESYKNDFRKEIVLKIEIVFAPEKKPKNLDSVIILASKDGVNQTMKLKNSKWEATFSNEQAQRCCGKSAFYFELVIDLKSDSIAKKESKHVLDNLWIEKTLADVTFKFEEKVIKAHSAIVASGSPVFCAMFQNDFKEKIERTVEIKDIQPNVFDHLLRYIYTGDADLDNVDVPGLLVASDKYGMGSLKEECLLRLSQTVNVENAVQNLVLARLHNSTSLHQSTLDFMSENSKTICCRKDWIELIQNHPDLSFVAMQMMLMGRAVDGKYNNIWS